MENQQKRKTAVFQAFLELQWPLTHFMAKGHVYVFNQYALVQEQTTGCQDMGEEKTINESSRKVCNIWLQNKQVIYEAA